MPDQAEQVVGEGAGATGAVAALASEIDEGDYAHAWARLAAETQAMFGSEAHFKQEEAARIKIYGRSFEVEVLDPTDAAMSWFPDSAMSLGTSSLDQNRGVPVRLSRPAPKAAGHGWELYLVVPDHEIWRLWLAHADGMTP